MSSLFATKSAAPKFVVPAESIELRSVCAPL